MILTTIVSIVFLELVAKAHVKSASEKKDNNNADED
jgi:hypothetical protein